MLEAVSMMGEANYAATDIICDSAVKYALFQCEIQLYGASVQPRQSAEIEHGKGLNENNFNIVGQFSDFSV